MKELLLLKLDTFTQIEEIWENYISGTYSFIWKVLRTLDSLYHILSSYPREGHKCETEEANQRSASCESKIRGSNREGWMGIKKRKKEQQQQKTTEHICVLWQGTYIHHVA